MKFTKLLTLFCLFVGLALSGCANVSFLDKSDSQETTVTQQADAEPVTALTPMQIKVLDLKAQPNVYTEQFSQSNGTLAPLLKKQFNQAMLHKSNGELDKAEALLKHLTESQPHLSGVWVQLASLELLKGEKVRNSVQNTHLDKSEVYLMNAISANELNFKAQNLLGQVLRKKGQFTQALAHYDKALKIWPAFPEAYLNRGVLYDLYLGKKTLALDDYSLYQGLLDEPSRQVKGWIIDLQRQLKAEQQRGSTL